VFPAFPGLDWEIRLLPGSDYESASRPGRTVEDAPAAAELPSDLSEELGWRYGYAAAADIPSKLTATQLKGREKDREAAEEGTALRPAFSRTALRRPVFEGLRPLTAAQRGTALHIAMQYLDFSDFHVERQIEQMVEEQKLTPEQAKGIDACALKRFLESGVADALRGAKKLYREFPFMQLINAKKLDKNAGEGEQVLPQGVIDCFYEDDDGLVVIDFKTDRIFSEEILQDRISGYRMQLETYANSLEIMFEKPVSKKILYFLSVSRAIEL
jgi:ATP-dependent helicase/nuclease subunit A